MSSLSDLFVSYKIVNLPTITIPKYNPTSAVDTMLLLSNMAAKVENIKTRMSESPAFKWTSGGAKDAPYTQPQVQETTSTTSIPSNYSGNFLDRVVKQESGGNHRAIGPKTKSGDRAYGLYLIMWNNVKKYSNYTKELFLNDPSELRRVAERLALELWASLTESDKLAIAKKGLSRDQAQAAMWFSGVGGLRDYLQGKNRSDGYSNVSKYINNLT